MPDVNLQQEIQSQCYRLTAIKTIIKLQFIVLAFGAFESRPRLYIQMIYHDEATIMVS